MKDKYTIGNYYKIPCIEYKEVYNRLEQVKLYELNIGYPTYKKFEYIYYLPVTSEKPHSDRENGQNYLHYHVDYRFEFGEKSKHYLFEDSNIRLEHTKNTKIVYMMMKCIKKSNEFTTPVSYIKNSKLKHKCIIKGKCPHRGQNLTLEPDINGVITCPNHGLQFDAITKQLITNNGK
jgi:hypothetical protein